LTNFKEWLMSDTAIQLVATIAVVLGISVACSLWAIWGVLVSIRDEISAIQPKQDPVTGIVPEHNPPK
jgi:hypothetical protein